MSGSLSRIRRLVFGISPEESTFRRRGFKSCDEASRRRLEKIGETFLHGYHAALEEDDDMMLASRLQEVAGELRGFAFEGAGMGLALRGFITPWKKRRLASFLNGAGAAHVYMIYVGMGWAVARLRRDPARALKIYDPLLRWLAIDGYGFHEGYFHWPAYVAQQKQPARLGGYALRAFDQGLGRSLWFIEGADARRIAATVAAFAPARHADLWSGVGLACAYAGGADVASLETLRAAAAKFAPQLAQGAAFAAKARERASNPARHTETACEVLCGLTATEAAQATDAALRLLPADGDEPAYEAWRRRIVLELAAARQRSLVERAG